MPTRAARPPGRSRSSGRRSKALPRERSCRKTTIRRCCSTRIDAASRGASGCARYRDEDEVDLLIIGCGAGGSDARPAARAARLARRRAGTRAVLGSRRRLGLRRGGRLPALLERAAGDRRQRPGRARQEQLRARCRRLDGALRRLHAPLPSLRLRDRDQGRGRRRLADSLPRAKPHYERVERELPVAGQHWPWGDPHGYPHAPHPICGAARAQLEGARAHGITMRVGPVAITNGVFGNRPHCIYRGFCLQGCKVNAKASPLVTHVPDAIEHGVEIRAESMAVGIELDAAAGRVTGATLPRRTARERFQRAAPSPSPATRSNRPGCCCNSTSARPSTRARQQRMTRSAAT